MPEKSTLKRVKKDKREGKSPSTQAGEFVRQEYHHVRAGKHGAKNKKQVIAIGLSEARRAGVKIPKKPAARRSPSSQARTVAHKRKSRTRTKKK